MYQCQLCLVTVPPRTPAGRVVVSSRPKTYPPRARANRVFRKPPDGKGKWEFTNDPGGTGREIARQVLACPACANGSGTA